MSQTRRQFAVVAMLVVVCCSVFVLAHQMTLKGTVAAIERTRIQVKTGEEKKGETPAWCLIDEKTKIFRGKTVVTFEAAKITVDEKVVVLVDHEADNKMTAIEIHLAAQ
jgi:hypothetical protein